ncbi:MAG TPA: hypothetical protein VL793_13155 [Patescibacteria group bacterium]|nr:hypothetical protein [Patescibacteria group bacterium]
MNEPDQPVSLPLEYAAQIVFELNSMRRECSELAGTLMRRSPLNERGLEECARLDDALSHAQGVLREALHGIRASQSKRRFPQSGDRAP